MITATYNIDAGQWTKAVDAALSDWSKHIVGNAKMSIVIVFDPSMKSPNIAEMRGGPSVYAGTTADGEKVSLPSGVAGLLGAGTGSFTIAINPNVPWSFAGPSSGKYDAETLMRHELGHAFGVTHFLGNDETPFEMNNDRALANESHLGNTSSLMWTTFYQGKAKQITAADVKAVSAGGAPTHGDDVIYISPGMSKLDAGSGDDTAIWLGRFNAFQADLVNIEALQLDGANPLTANQADLYRLYQAAFDRAPDLAGFQWWDGADINEAADGFAASAEFKTLYGQADHGDLVTALYDHILDRAPDAAGYQYWLTRDDLAPADLLSAFALAPENTIDAVIFTV